MTLYLHFPDNSRFSTRFNSFRKAQSRKGSCMFFMTSDFRACRQSGGSIEGRTIVAFLLPKGEVSQATEAVIESSFARRSILFPNEGTRAAQVRPSPLRDRNFSLALQTDSYFASLSRHHRPMRVKGCHAGIAPALRGRAGVTGTPQN
jgi:hypothetical protein